MCPTFKLYAYCAIIQSVSKVLTISSFDANFREIKKAVRQFYFLKTMILPFILTLKRLI